MSDERDALALAWGQGYHRGRLDEAEGLDKPPNPYWVIANASDGDERHIVRGAE